jgi:hypothetical protein
MLTPVEGAVIRKILDGNDEILAMLRKQADVLVVVDREMAGVGFFTRLSIPNGVHRIPDRRSLQLGNVVAEIAGLKGVPDFCKKMGSDLHFTQRRLEEEK